MAANSPGGPPGLWGAGHMGEASTGLEQGSREADLQREIAGTIQKQVLRLLEDARKETEERVKVELKGIRDAMVAMDQRLDQLLLQLDALQMQKPAEVALDADAVGALLSKVEQQWGQEIRTLKEELHQTILAHNHNADLIKHHKDTIDALRERCIKTLSNTTRTAEVQQQLAKLDARLKLQQQQQKPRALEPLFARLAALEQRVHLAAQAAAVQGAAWRCSTAMGAAAAAMGGVPPGGLGLPGRAVPAGIPASLTPPWVGGVGSAARAKAQA